MDLLRELRCVLTPVAIQRFPHSAPGVVLTTARGDSYFPFSGTSVLPLQHGPYAVLAMRSLD